MAIEMINISEALYRLKGSVKSLTGHKYGEVLKAPNEVGKNISSTRAGETDPSKISGAASLFDALIAHTGEMAAYWSRANGMILLEYEGMKLVCSDCRIYQLADSGNITSSKYYAMGSVMYELGRGTTPEMIGAMKRILADPTDPDPADYFLFSDAYYYGVVKRLGISELELYEKGSADRGRIKRQFSDGDWIRLDEKIPALKGFLGDSDWDVLMPSAAKKEEAPKPKKAKASKKAEKASAMTPEERFFAEAKDGKFVIHYDGWTESQKAKIRDPKKDLESYEPIPEYFETVKKAYLRLTRILKRMESGLTGEDAIGDDAVNILLEGVPGSGKSRTIEAVFATLGLPYEVVPMSKNTDESVFEGKNIIDEDGKVKFAPTPFLTAFEQGGGIVCEEINLPHPSVTMGCLSQVIEAPYILMKAGYIPVKRHPLTVVVGTMNVGTEGSCPLNPALITRFTPFEVPAMDDSTAVKVLELKTGHDADVCKWVVNAFNTAKNYLEQQDAANLLLNIAVARDGKQAIMNMEEGQEPRRALVNSIVGHIYATDPEVAKHIEEEVVAILPAPTFKSIAVEW